MHPVYGLPCSCLGNLDVPSVRLWTRLIEVLMLQAWLLLVVWLRQFVTAPVPVGDLMTMRI